MCYGRLNWRRQRHRAKPIPLRVSVTSFACKINITTECAPSYHVVNLIKEIARYLVPDIIAFFETEEAKREFEKWKAEQDKKLAEKAKNEAMPK